MLSGHEQFLYKILHIIILMRSREERLYFSVCAPTIHFEQSKISMTGKLLLLRSPRQCTFTSADLANFSKDVNT